VAVLVAAAYGVVSVGTAQAAQVTAFEAENMTPKSPTIKPVPDTGANNEFALRYTANGHATKDVGLSQAADSVMVRARNSHNATNAVCIRVRLGRTPIAPDQCLGRGASTCRDVMFSSVGVPAGAAVRIAVSALEVQGKDALHVGKVRLDGPASPQAPAPTGQACNLNQRIANATDGQVIDGGGCVERSYVELRKKLTLKNITVSGTDNWTGGFSPSGGDYRSTLTVPELVELQQTSDPMNTTLCESQDAAMLCSEAEMVFLDGRYLSQRPDGADPGPGEFALDAGRRVMLGDDPTGKKVEGRHQTAGPAHGLRIGRHGPGECRRHPGGQHDRQERHGGRPGQQRQRPDGAQFRGVVDARERCSVRRRRQV
jgi:hypothetical protein